MHLGELDMASAKGKTTTIDDHFLPQSSSTADRGSPTTAEDEKAQDSGRNILNNVSDNQHVKGSPQKPEDHAANSEVLSPQAAEGAAAQQDIDHLEAAHPIFSGSAYSVFGHRQRQFIVFMVACAGFFSPLSANIYFPALNSLARDLKVSNGMMNLSLTTYMIFQGLAPTVFGDLADMTGRRPTYLIGFIVYIGANVGLALQNNYAALLVLRCLQSTGSSGTVALGSGVVADIASSGERGKFMGILCARSSTNQITD